MAKMADKYFKVEPWKIVEDGFDPAHSRVSESIFSIGNEYMGVRGYFEEGYTGDSLKGSYFNGIYEREKQSGSAYKGVVDQTEFMVNSVDWLYTRISIDGETLNLAHSEVRSFRRELDMRNGLLKRSFQWETKSGKKLEVSLERLVSMPYESNAAQKITLKALNFSGEAEVELGGDFGIMHEAYGKNYWECISRGIGTSNQYLIGKTQNTNQLLFSDSRYQVENRIEFSDRNEQKAIKRCFRIRLTKAADCKITRIVTNLVCKAGTQTALKDFEAKCVEQLKEYNGFTYEFLLEENRKWWKAVWESSDIVIEGDKENQQGIRYCIFQMFQTYHGAQEGNNIGAKGLTGEAYNGNAFWDTETYCLPFYLFHDPKAAKSLLMFRYQTLGEAQKKAEMLDCKGAFYPIATISGRECCNLWQHASLQLQASTAVAYGIWLYEKIIGDTEFLETEGIVMLVELCRMLASRGDWSADQKSYGYYGVMGPDEFQMMVNHDCYTNYMAKFTLEYTLEVLQKMKAENRERWMAVIEKESLHPEETALWKNISAAMYIPKDEKSGIYEQHDGFFRLPHVEINEIPIEEFPLYHHWSYDRIYRNDMIKQPDVLMLMLLFNHQFSRQELLINYNYYEPKCIHESSLSPSVHSILAMQLDKYEEAYRFFQFATRMDLDNYNRNTQEGLHTTSIAAAWMNIVYGFGGMRSDGVGLEFSPAIPSGWEKYSFRINYQDTVLVVEVDSSQVCLRLLGEGSSSVRVYGEPLQISNHPQYVKMRKQWKEAVG